MESDRCYLCGWWKSWVLPTLFASPGRHVLRGCGGGGQWGSSRLAWNWLSSPPHWLSVRCIPSGQRHRQVQAASWKLSHTHTHTHIQLKAQSHIKGHTIMHPNHKEPVQVRSLYLIPNLLHSPSPVSITSLNHSTHLSNLCYTWWEFKSTSKT